MKFRHVLFLFAAGAIIALSACTPQQQGVVDHTLDVIDNALLVMECNQAVLRSTNQSIKDLCPVEAERKTCPAMVQILADLAIQLDKCKEGI